jgi:hypothetical protein
MSIYLVTCCNKECGKEFKYNTDDRNSVYVLRDMIPKKNIVECPFCGELNSILVYD